MREIIFRVIFYATAAALKDGNVFYQIVGTRTDRWKETHLGKCDLNALILPENADSWKCNKAVDQGKVAKYTRCKLVCQDGYDLSRGTKLTQKL